MELVGITYGDKVFNFSGTTIVRDHINRIEAEVIYFP